MPIFFIAVAILSLPVIGGLVLGFVMSKADEVVTVTKDEIENKDTKFNASQTLGLEIEVAADRETQLKQARILAAKQAAATPRGANLKIGRLGSEQIKTAQQGVDEDPWTAAKIAMHHGWDGARTGFLKDGEVAESAPAQTSVIRIRLIPGKDYPAEKVTADMSLDAKRKARIANAKARAKAYAEAKKQVEAGTYEASAPAKAPASASAPVTQTKASAPAQPTVPSNIPEPNYIDITDDMSPEDKRKARIQNSKERSKYNKALKAAGIDPKSLKAGESSTPAPKADATPDVATLKEAEKSTAPTVPSNIPEPNYIDITDDMSPEDKRNARIQNSKERSKYNKALKAAGIDPKSLKK